MEVGTLIRRNTYLDSVALMQLSSELTKLEGVEDAAAMMDTETNQGILADADMLTPEAKEAKPNDLCIVIKARDKDSVSNALSQVDHLLTKEINLERQTAVDLPDTITEALDQDPTRNIVLISTPGSYAATEAYKALQNDKHVFLFSDNVSIDDEVFLKQIAVQKGLLMMGPDCGTAIINGHPLGFANVVRRGPIGLVAASGTGLQEVTSLLHRLGSGVSQAIGIGSRDLKDNVGGIMMDFSFHVLENDPETSVIVLISKPPSHDVSMKILHKVQSCKKPVVINFLDGDLQEIDRFGAIPAFTLEDAAVQAVTVSIGEKAEPSFFTIDKTRINEIIDQELSRLSDQQKWIRGLYSGGTFTSETQMLLRDIAGKVYSNVPTYSNLEILKGESSREHTIIDFGEDDYTVGKPHPMIDTRSRIEAIAVEAQDPEVAVILLDIVLGFGSHDDPASDFAPAIEEALRTAGKENRYISFIASICGTDEDNQNRRRQKDILSDAGVIIMESNAQAARLAGLIASRQNF